MIEAGDILESYKVVHVTDHQAALVSQRTGELSIWVLDSGKLMNRYTGSEIGIIPKTVYNGAFGESAEMSYGEFYRIRQDEDSGRFEIDTWYKSSYGEANIFITKEDCQSYCDALNCLQIDLREHSVEPVDDVKQWSLALEDCGGALYLWKEYTIGNKLDHALPWYETKEEAEKHLADSARIIESLKTMKGISK